MQNSHVTCMKFVYGKREDLNQQNYDKKVSSQRIFSKMLADWLYDNELTCVQAIKHSEIL